MPDPAAGLPPRFLRTPEAARFPQPLRPHAREAPNLRHRPDNTGRSAAVSCTPSTTCKAWADRAAPRRRPPIPASGTVLPAKPHMNAVSPTLCRSVLGVERGPPRDRQSEARSSFERDQLDLFQGVARAISRRVTRRTSWPIRSSRSPSRSASQPIDYPNRRTVAIRVEAVPEHGMATIWDADVLIWAASQIVRGERRWPEAPRV
jgi:hypothetical protein